MVNLAEAPPSFPVSRACGARASPSRASCHATPLAPCCLAASVLTRSCNAVPGTESADMHGLARLERSNHAKPRIRGGVNIPNCTRFFNLKQMHKHGLAHVKARTHKRARAYIPH